MAHSLSEKQTQVLEHLKAGKTEKQIVKAMKSTDPIIKRQVTILRKNGYLENGDKPSPDISGSQPSFDKMVPPPVPTPNGSGDLFEADRTIEALIKSQVGDLATARERLAKTIKLHQERLAQIAEQKQALSAEASDHEVSIKALEDQSNRLATAIDAVQS